MTDDLRQRLLKNLNTQQSEAVSHQARLLGVVAGAGSGKTEVMARRVAWWIGVDGVDRAQIAAFTFTEAAAEELKFRVRERIGWVTPEDVEPSLAGLYLGTIHAFCLKCLREFAAGQYYNYDVLDDVARMALVQRGYFNVLGLKAFEEAAKTAGRARGRFDAIDLFLRSYDILNEHVALAFVGSERTPPPRVEDERDWCAAMACSVDLGADELNLAFATTAARYYAFIRARRFLDFSTAQAEFVRLMAGDAEFRGKVTGFFSRLVVDEVQDINPAQIAIIQALIDAGGHVTAVGDHRQAIYAFRGGRVDLMGRLFDGIRASPDGVVLDLPANYRSTPRIIEIANRWSATIRDNAGMDCPAMTLGVTGRTDLSDQHCGIREFSDRSVEADWIAETICSLAPPNRPDLGARHGEGDRQRGLGYSDIAVLVRSSSEISAYAAALRSRGVPAVVRGGADLFSQPEVLLFLSALSLASGSSAYFGGPRSSSMPERVRVALSCGPDHPEVIEAACAILADRGLRIPGDGVARLLNLAQLISLRLRTDGTIPLDGVDFVSSPGARAWLRTRRKPRRIFPQTLFQWVLEEAGFGQWGDVGDPIYEAARFHVGQLSFQLKGLESSGWIGADDDLKFQLIGFLMWGVSGARIPEAPLLVPPDAVTVTTIHSAKGLEFAAVFIADVNWARFPSHFAKRRPDFAFDESKISDFSGATLADNDNLDHERRLMYVALTRAERYLFVTSAPKKNRSRFHTELQPLFRAAGATSAPTSDLGGSIEHLARRGGHETRLATSFSDLRYYLECPQDFYMRKVLGFTPPIGQEFGYGRGVHNLLRAVHEDAAAWAALSRSPGELTAAVEALVDDGLFYLRHTVGRPYDRLRAKAVQGVSEYVTTYASELERLKFEPERAFETLFPEDRVLITGAIDVVRLDSPPRVTLIDFKSGRAGGNASGLSERMMAMQLGIYGIAAEIEMSYEPERGLIRYIGEPDDARRETPVLLGAEATASVRSEVVTTARSIRNREFQAGPTEEDRCGRCDFGAICASAGQ